MKGNVVWSIKEIAEILQQRTKNEFDGNITATGSRGDGKSTLLSKILYRLKGFKPQKHQVYSRDDVVELLQSQQFGFCFDDEGINTGYKRDWQNKGQQELIKIITNYRDNYNIFATAIPNFFSLDKDLRDLYFMHFHVIERGLAVVHMPLQGRLYSQDRWDAKNNAKIEESWSKKMQSNPDFKPQYHKLSTFRGYLYFGDLTKKQKALYKEIKKTKRAIEYKEDESGPALSFIDKVYNQLVGGKLTRDGLTQICLMEDKKYSSITTKLNVMLTDKGIKETLGAFLLPNEDKKNNSSSKSEIASLVD